jgi:hypothetical protein
MHRLAAALACLAILLARPAAAQGVRGDLLERGSGRPIPAALVVLLDERGARVAGALTDAGGRFELRAPRAGAYTLRADRVGYRSTLSPPLALGAGQTLVYRMEGDAAAVSLAGITARSGRRCRVRPGAGESTALLWEEARKALSAASHARAAALLHFDVELYRRDLAPGALTVLREERERRSGQGHTPFVSHAPDSLSARGYVRAEGDSLVFEAPDADVLLSDRFLADHCFRVEEDPDEPALVGLAFEPVAGRRRFTEVAGVLWIDRGTAELRRLEYRYVHVPAHFTSAGAGGRLEFRRLPSGSWMVERWWIRMPVFERSASFGALTGGLQPIRGTSYARLAMIHEGGGEVVGSSVREGRGLARAGRVTGMVWDSLESRPMAGARAFLSGTSWSALADSAGRFAIEGVPEGRYTVSFEHPGLRAWGTVPGSAPVEVRAGEAAAVALASPSVEALVARQCARESLRDFPGVVMGVVTRAGEAQPRARVKLTWRWFNPLTRTLKVTGSETAADEHGFYLVCGVPVDVQIHFAVTPAGGAPFHERFILRDRAIGRMDVRIGPARNEP